MCIRSAQRCSFTRPVSELATCHRLAEIITISVRCSLPNLRSLACAFGRHAGLHPIQFLLASLTPPYQSQSLPLSFSPYRYHFLLTTLTSYHSHFLLITLTSSLPISFYPYHVHFLLTTIFLPYHSCSSSLPLSLLTTLTPYHSHSLPLSLLTTLTPYHSHSLPLSLLTTLIPYHSHFLLTTITSSLPLSLLLTTLNF